MLAVQARALSKIYEIRTRYALVALFSHGDVIRAVLAHFLGLHLDLFQRIVIGTASITAIAYGRTNATALTVNSMDGDLAALLG